MLGSLFRKKKINPVPVEEKKKEIADIQKKKDHRLSELSEAEIAKAIRAALNK
ncbi:hypothetical protein SAMN02745975_01472 [Geosporobacter subterraneus DSM 17957]|uniref:Uncharacterized protein n=1 Tax=Geosporobacter subterraneus DSM 17957 TaxID=1121919 RepID=A0A1M6H7I8_9FIRM|nr:hypothetical protein [Geosporobacter subterraneus]SHJ18150.1 hypothetical protein SAMN02745975_01472 [Geosporobacter subterraneus DSM 17957]